MFASQRSKHEVKVPYGYKKKSADGKDIIPDEAASVIVQYIFKLCAGGKGPSQIARILENEQILTLAHYYYRKYGKGHARMDMQRPYGWSSTSIADILDNMIYPGHTHSLKSTTLSYKNKTTVDIPEKEQIIVKNTHELLIDKDCGALYRMSAPASADHPNARKNLICSLALSSALTAANPWCCTGRSL